MIYWFTVYRLRDGEVIGAMTTDEASLAINTSEGCSAVLGEYLSSAGHITDGAFVEYSPAAKASKAKRPTHPAEWSNTTLAWVDARALPQAKADAWSRIKAERERRLAGTFTHAGHTYDIDPVNLSGASIDAREALIAGEPWSQLWVLADNTVATLTAAEMIAVGRACKAEVSNLWATSQYLRGLIEAATTSAAIEAITWP